MDQWEWQEVLSKKIVAMLRTGVQGKDKIRGLGGGGGGKGLHSRLCWVKDQGKM